MSRAHRLQSTPTYQSDNGFPTSLELPCHDKLSPYRAHSQSCWQDVYKRQMQDTKAEEFEFLNTAFDKNKIKVQYFGDENQAIYQNKVCLLYTSIQICKNTCSFSTFL